MASCVPQKKILYLQDMPKEDSTTAFINDRNLDYKIQPGDNLYIKINSLDVESTIYYNGLSSANTNNITPITLYLYSYLVNDSGYFNYPSLGYINVMNKTAEEVQNHIQNSFKDILSDAVVIVRLASFRITLLGEFKRPGKYEVYQNAS